MLVTAHFMPSANTILFLGLAIILQLAGHVVRAYKMSFLLRPVKSSTPRFQFRALSLGYLFNTLLPFRLGELVRAQVIAGAEKVSFGFALTLIIIERAIDALMLATIGLTLYVAFHVSATFLAYVATFVFVGGLLIIGITIIGRESRWVLSMTRVASGLFNADIKLAIQFKVWTIIYGIQRIVTRERLVQYLGLTIVSWAFYIFSMLAITQCLFSGYPIGDKITLAMSPYYGISVPAGPASLGSFTRVTNTVSSTVSMDSTDRTMFNLLCWGILLGPIALLGAVFLLTKTKEKLWRRLPVSSSAAAMNEKLLRTEDVSKELTAFLENYFSNNSLSQIVHRLELRKNFRLLKYFKGGSDAITILASQDGRVLVKKIIAPEFANRLKAQYDWLYRRRNQHSIVQVLAEHQEKNFYAIDLAYDAENELFSNYMHNHSIADSKRIMQTIWAQLHKTIYARTTTTHDPVALNAYIEKHVIGCLEQAVAVQDDLKLATLPKKIRINGVRYDNLLSVLDKIQMNPQAMQDLATFKQSKEVHGDVAVDNILVSRKTGDALLIDPAPDGNIINGPVFDFGKNMQSLYCGYEFMLWGKEVVSLEDDGSIFYRDQRSTQYMELCEYIRNDLAPKYLSVGEQRAMLFHAAALLIRRLKHQVYQNPAVTLALYAAGVKTFNEFLDQYK